jgi:hypothetical protein
VPQHERGQQRAERHDQRGGLRPGMREPGVREQVEPGEPSEPSQKSRHPRPSSRSERVLRWRRGRSATARRPARSAPSTAGNASIVWSADLPTTNCPPTRAPWWWRRAPRASRSAISSRCPLAVSWHGGVNAAPPAGISPFGRGRLGVSREGCAAR